VPEDELADAQEWIGNTLGKTAWSTTSTPTARNRAALFATAVALRPRLTDEDAAKLDTALATDLVAGLEATTDDEHVEEVLTVARTIAARVAVEVESQAAQLTTSVATLRLRIAAAARGSGATLTAADIIAVDGLEGEKEVFAEWLALKPPLAETQQVFGNIPIYTNALDQYARALDIEDRTTLWIDLANRGANWSQAAFQAIGKHGLNSAAVEYIAKEVAAATQQIQRDALIDRLETAKLIEQPQHKAATDLVLQLLGTGVAGDISLAARVADLTGGAAYGKTVQMRQAFDTAISTKPKALTSKQQERLQQINLMNKPLKKRPKGLRGLLGG
jgi:hypothetical protein